MEAARPAPSTVNLQTWSFAVFTADEWRATFDRPIPFRGAAVIVLADTHRARSVLDVFPASPLVEYTVAVMNDIAGRDGAQRRSRGAGGIFGDAIGDGAQRLPRCRLPARDASLPDHIVPLMTIVLGSGGGYPPMPLKLPLDQITFTGQYRSRSSRHAGLAESNGRGIQCQPPCHPSRGNWASTSRRSPRRRPICTK